MATVRVLVESVSPTGCWLRLTLFGSDATSVSSRAVATHFQPVVPNRFSFACLSVSPSDLRAWSPEQPYLYTLAIELLVGESAAVPAQCEVVRVGFRDVYVAPLPLDVHPVGTQKFLKLNGVPMVVCGVNYHEHDRRTGKTVTEEQYHQDILLMKKSNFNAVRCSHYPHAQRFYELCNEIGLMVCDEANIETHGFALSAQMSFLACAPEWLAAIVDRVRTMYMRSRHHPSICIWSLGNESGYGPNLAAAARVLRSLDGGRTPLQVGVVCVCEGVSD